MSSINELRSILDANLEWNKSRTDCFARMVLSLLMAQTVTLSKLARLYGRTKNKESTHKRITRFFSEFEIGYDDIAKMIFKFFVGQEAKVYLIFDRTEWQFGRKWINILTLAIGFRGIAIPIYWKVLGRRGNSNIESRIELLEKFRTSLGMANVDGLLCDREFIGEKWFKELAERGITFYARIKKDAVVKSKEVGLKNVWQCCLRKSKENPCVLSDVEIYGQTLNISGSMAADGEMVIVATNGEAKSALKLYSHRWEIENLFQCLKSRGFRFEETHLTDDRKIEKLVALLAVGFAWAYKVGIWVDKNIKQIEIKKHGRKQNSFFRYGLDLLVEFMLPARGAYRVLCKFVRLLRAPPSCLGYIPLGDLL